MSTSSKAFQRLLKDTGYFRKKILDFLKFKGNKKKTGEAAAEFLCDFDDKRSDLVQAVNSIESILIRISQLSELDCASSSFDLVFPEGTFRNGGRDYLSRLFELFDIYHKIFLYCLDEKWDKFNNKYKKMAIKRGFEIIDEFDFSNYKSPLFLIHSGYCVTARLESGGKLDEPPVLEGNLLLLEREYSHHPKEIRRMFPLVADYIEEEAPSSKKRRPNPTEDD